MFKKSWENKLNALLENGIKIINITKQSITLSNDIIIECDNNYDFMYMFYHGKNEYINHGFMETETINYKSVKIFIDNLMYDLFHAECI